MQWGGFTPTGFGVAGAQFTPWGFGYAGAGFGAPGCAVPAAATFTPGGPAATFPILPPHGGGTYMNAYGMGSGFTLW